LSKKNERIVEERIVERSTCFASMILSILFCDLCAIKMCWFLVVLQSVSLQYKAVVHILV
jgi:hypothetical protein